MFPLNTVSIWKHKFFLNEFTKSDKWRHIKRGKKFFETDISEMCHASGIKLKTNLVFWKMKHKTILCSKYTRQYFSKEFQFVIPENYQLTPTIESQHKCKKLSFVLCHLLLERRRRNKIQWSITSWNMSFLH